MPQKQHLVIVSAVDVILVVQAGDAAVGNQTRAAILHNVRRSENEGAPVTSIDGQVADELLPNSLRDLGLIRVDNVRLAGYLNLGGRATRGQAGVYGQNLPDGQH